MSSLYHIIYQWLMVVIRPLSLFFPSGLDIDEKRKRAMAVIGSIVGIPILIFFVYDDITKGDELGMMLDAGMAFLFMTFLFFSRNVINGIWFYRLLMSGLMADFVYGMYSGFTGDSSLVFMYIFPLAVFFVLGIPEGLPWYLLLTVTNVVLLFFPDAVGAYEYSLEMRVRHMNVYLIITFLSFCFEFLRWYFYMQLEQEREKLKEAMEHVRTLDGLVPICSMCKKIRDDKGYWNQLEQYLLEHTDAKLTHGICDDCYAKHYPKEFAHRKTKAINIVQSETDETCP